MLGRLARWSTLGCSLARFRFAPRRVRILPATDVKASQHHVAEGSEPETRSEPEIRTSQQSGPAFCVAQMALEPPCPHRPRSCCTASQHRVGCTQEREAPRSKLARSEPRQRFGRQGKSRRLDDVAFCARLKPVLGPEHLDRLERHRADEADVAEVGQVCAPRRALQPRWICVAARPSTVESPSSRSHANMWLARPSEITALMELHAIKHFAADVRPRDLLGILDHAVRSVTFQASRFRPPRDLLEPGGSEEGYGKRVVCVRCREAPDERWWRSRDVGAPIGRHVPAATSPQLPRLSMR